MRSGRGSSLFALGAHIGDEGKVDESVPPTAFASLAPGDEVASGSGTSFLALRLCAGL